MSVEPRAENLRTLIHEFVRGFGLLDQTKTPCGMPISVSDAYALMELLKDPGIEQIKLARRLGLSKSATTRLIQRLIRRGQIKRIKSANDGRAYNLQLTEKGNRQAITINKESLATFKAITSNLSENAVEHLLEYMPHLIQALPRSNQGINKSIDDGGKKPFHKNKMIDC